MSASRKPSGGGKPTPEEQLLAAIYDTRREIAEARTGTSGKPPDPPPSDCSKTVHNERVKLTATLLNGVALAFLVGGAVATFLGIGNLPNPNDQLIRALI